MKIKRKSSVQNIEKLLFDKIDIFSVKNTFHLWLANVLNVEEILVLRVIIALSEDDHFSLNGRKFTALISRIVNKEYQIEYIQNIIRTLESSGVIKLLSAWDVSESYHVNHNYLISLKINYAYIAEMCGVSQNINEKSMELVA